MVAEAGRWFATSTEESAVVLDAGRGLAPASAMSPAATVLGSCLCHRLVAWVWSTAVGPAALTVAEA
eukprot:2000360-Pleurochrysis_carterae.AAC.1